MAENEVTEMFQDVISQLPFLNGYTHLVRIFEVPKGTSRDVIFREIQEAYGKLRSKIPWLSEQVVSIKKGDGSSDFITSAPWPKSSPPSDAVRADKDTVLSSYRTLLRLGCPLSSIPSEHIAPCPGLPQAHGLPTAPVTALRVTFIEGGVIIVISTHHNMIDGHGTMLLWSYLATLMSGNDISDEDIYRANTDRSRVVPLLPPGVPRKDYSHLVRPDPWPLGRPPQTIWRVFMMKRSELPELRSSLTAGNGAPSTDDALSAWCWKRICVARLRTGRCNGKQVSKFGRALDARRSVGITRGYIGHMVMHAATRLTLDEVVQTPLAELALKLREDKEAAATEWSVRSYVTFLAGVKNKSTLMYGGLYNPETDIGGSSLLHWVGKPCSMGMLGQSHIFRRAGGPTIPGCMYFFPSDNDELVQIVLCMPEETLSALVEDSEWNRYVKPSGE